MRPAMEVPHASSGFDRDAATRSYLSRSGLRTRSLVRSAPMSGRLAVLVGLLAGLVTAGTVMAVALVNAPQIADSLYPTPSVLGPTPAPSVPSLAPPPSPSAVAGRSPSAAPSAASSAPSGSGASPSGSGAPPSGSGGQAFMIGEPAPALVLPLLGGGTIDLAELRGSPVWVNFMATWCEPCQDEFPLMSAFQARYEEAGLIVLGVDVREDPDTVAAFMDEVGGVFRMALDEDGAAQREWGALALPIHFWVDAEGIIRDGALGGIGPDAMASGLQTILPGVEVTPP
jgi:thiol-disulfide isomerase/thioredoxin